MKDDYYSRFKKIVLGWKLNVIVVVSYLILTIILTFPVAFLIGREIPGGGDAFQAMKICWYTNFALLNPDITSLTYNNMIFYPNGIPITPFPSAFNQILTIILLPFFQLHIIYSLLWLLSFILAAFGTYLLVKYLTQNNYAAFLAGIIFAFAPYHMVHGLGHVGATTIQWIPFCALFFMKVFREGGIKNGILAGIFYVLVVMSDLQYMVFMGIFIAVLFLYEHFISLQKNKCFNLESHKSILIKYLIIGIVAFSIILPLTITDILTATSGNNFLKPNPLEAVTYSTDLMSFFLPSTLHPVFGGFVAPIYQNFTGNISENTTYIGYAVLFLSIFALFVFRKDLTVRFWGIIVLFFSLLSMGPVLHVAGKTVFTVFKISVPLPHLILYYLVPFIDNSRTTGRFFIIAVLAFAVLAGYGCNELMKRHATKKKIIVILLCAFVIFEYLCIPYYTSSVDQPPFYQKIGQDSDQYALLEIPITASYGAGTKIIYYQTIHQKQVVGGWAARMPNDARVFEKNTPFIRELTFSQQPQNDIINQSVYSVGNSILQYYNIRYVILHKIFLTKEQLKNTQAFISQCNPVLPKVYEDKTLVVYEQNRTEPVSPFMSFGEGWHGLENRAGIPSRWTSSNASIQMYSDNSRDMRLNFTAKSFVKERGISIRVNNEDIGTYQITPKFIDISIPVKIHKGVNSLEIISSEGCERPIDIPELNSKDSRCLSLSIQNITLM